MKKIMLILIPVIVLGVGVGLAMTGIINVPGLSPKAKAKTKSAQLYTEGKDPKLAVDQKKSEPIVPKKTPPPAKVEVAALETKPELGQKKLAKLWNEMEPAALQAVTKDWKESELASVLLKMDSTKVAELLTKIDAKRASNLSREMQKQASLVPRETGV